MGDGFGVEVFAGQGEVNLEFRPDGGRVGGALAFDADFQPLQVLPFLFQNYHHVDAAARAQAHDEQLHRAGAGVALAVAVEREGVAAGAGGAELFALGPSDGCLLHDVLPQGPACPAYRRQAQAG